MKKLLLILPLLLISACDTETTTQKQIEYDYDKVHIYEVGCVPRTSCRTVWLRNVHAGTALIEYSDPDGNLFVTSSYALVKGSCPICDGQGGLRMIRDTPLTTAIEDSSLAFQTATPFCIGNQSPFGACPYGYNRKVRRYAEKRGVPLDKAFAAIYGGKGK